MPFKSGSRKAERDTNGDPTYPCLWIGCNKTFGTAQHVRRHEKTHLGSTPYPCPYCDKSFGRSDVRAKHIATMHPHQPNSSSSGAMAVGKDTADDVDDAAHFRRRSFAASDLDEKDDLLPPSKARRISSDSDVHSRPTSSRQTSYEPSTTFAESFNYPHPPLLPPPSLSQLPTLTPSSTAPSTAIGISALVSSSSPNITFSGPAGMMLPPPPQMGTPFSIASSHSSGFIDPAALSVGPSAQPLPSIDLGLDTDLFPGTIGTDLPPFDPSWEWFGHLFGWGTDENIDLDIGLQNSMFEGTGVGPVSSTDTLSAAWLLCATPRGGSPAGDGEKEQGDGEGQKGKSRSMADPFGRNHESPWPNVFKPKVPDRPLTLAGIKASPRAHRPRASPEAISETSRNAMLSLVYLSHQPHWLMPDVDDFPDSETLSDFVDLYFENFHPLFPVIHKPTFLGNQDTPAVLLLSVAAIGATYADPEFGPMAVALCELVRRMIAWMRGSDQRAKFDKNALLAFVLQTALGMACGSREMFYHSEIFRCSIVTTCRRLHLLRGIGTATDELYAKEKDPGLEARYKAYLEDEGRRRLGWGVYLLDCQMAALLHIPSIFSPSEAVIRLPTEECLWSATDAEAWQQLITDGHARDPIEHRPKFLHLLAKSLAGKEEDYRDMSDLGVGILAHTVWRMLMDEHQHLRALGVGLSENGMCLPTIAMDTHVLDSKPAQLLFRLARSTFPTSTSPSQLRLTPTALFHYAHIHFTRPGLMERIRNASGRYEPDMTDKGSLEWLLRWSVGKPDELRKVLWHAGVLQALCAEFPRGSPAELFFTFDCALVFWAVIKYASAQLSSDTFRSALFAANWFDTSPPSMWLAHGGQIVFPFLGPSGEWTLSSLLKLFMDRLEGMPWGLAGQYRLVLGKL